MNVAKTLQILLPEFQSFLALVVRVGGLLAAMPVLSGHAVPMKVKVLLVLGLGLSLAPLIRLPAMPLDPLPLAAGLAGELAIGLTIGLAVRLFFGALELAGDLVGMQMGFGVVQLLDPATSHQTPVIGRFFTLLAVLVFLSFNGHLWVVSTIVASYNAIPAFGTLLPMGLGEEILYLSREMFVIGLKLAAPVLATVLVTNVLLAILGRAVAQINVFVLSFPVTIAGGLAILVLAMPFVVELLGREIERLELAIERLLRVMGYG